VEKRVAIIQRGRDVMAVVGRYLRVYQQFLSSSLSEAMSFRAHFVLLIVMDSLFYLTTLLSVGFIYDHVELIGVWGRWEFLFFVAFMLTIDQIHMTFISQNFWQFSRDIVEGKLDFLLLKPIGGIFLVFFRRIRPATIFTLFIPWGTLLYCGIEIELSLFSWLLLPFFLLLGLVLLVSLEILISLSMFWTYQSIGINFLRMQFQSVSRWPDFVYRHYFRKVFTILMPVLLIGSAPVHFLIDREWLPLVGMFLAIFVCWVLINIFWKLGLRRYESASS